MKYIDALRENTHISEVYLCQQKATYLTKSGEPIRNRRSPRFRR